jgi:hypothetical protein
LDIDRKPELGKPDGLESFYKTFPRETLPAELQDLPGSFPCYTQTPSGGFHLYFRYNSPEVKLRELAPGVEIKETQITAPRITLDVLAGEAVSAYGGHHDRQVSFAGRACRCKFSGAETLVYVKARPEIFGNGADTESTVLSVFKDNGGRL